jgi:hypothetical protein
VDTSTGEAELVYENQMARLYWDADLETVEIEAKGEASSAQFRDGAESALRLIGEKRALRLLADLVHMGKLSDEDLLWTATNWSARLEQTSIKFTAIVVPKSLSLHMSLHRMVETTDPGSAAQATKFFEDVHAAREWLKQQRVHEQ